MSFNKVTARNDRGISGKCKDTNPDARKAKNSKGQDTSTNSRMKELLNSIEKVLAKKS